MAELIDLKQHLPAKAAPQLVVEIAKITFDLVSDTKHLLVDVDCIHRFDGVSVMKTHIGKFEKKYSPMDVMVGLGCGDLPPPFAWPEKEKTV